MSLLYFNKYVGLFLKVSFCIKPLCCDYKKLLTISNCYCPGKKVQFNEHILAFCECDNIPQG